jgi:uncharacterized protein (DUF433 family)
MQIPDRAAELDAELDSAPKAGDLELTTARINEVKLVDPWSSDWIRSIGSHQAHAMRTEEWYVQCAYHGLLSLHQCVEVDPHRRGGVPVLKGTRVTVAEALGEIADSSCIREVADNFDLDFENLKCLLNGLSLLLNRPYPG